MTRLREFLRLPEALMVGGFGAVILAGTLLLMLPWAHVPGRVGFLEALFTATSAVCVTGLIVVDTGTDFTLFGQIVIMLLIQAGGLGIMTFAALTFQFLGKRLSLKSQALLHGSFFQRDIGADFKRIFRQILVITLVTEFVGATLLFVTLWGRRTHLGEAFLSAIFHAISAFCNAGFSLYQDSLIGLRDSPVFITTIMMLIILGGLGHLVIHELWDRFSRYFPRQEMRLGQQRLSVHTRVVLWMSFGLILSGCAGLLLLGLTDAEIHWLTRITEGLFQSVTARTAGFNSVDIGRLPLSSLLLLVILMFIGGSPASCAGGIKTTACAILGADLLAKLRGETDVKLLNRRVPTETVWRVTILLRLAVLWNLMGFLLLLATERAIPNIGMHDVLFEQISAFGTVGLTTGITDKLSVIGRLWIIATMFVGRLGPLTLVMWILPIRQAHVRYPEGRIMIG